MEVLTVIFIILLFALIIAGIVVSIMLLTKYNRITEELINRRLNQLSEKTDNNLLIIENHINDFMSKTQNILKTETKELSKKIISNINDNEKNFRIFITESEKSLKKQNEQFSNTIKGIETRYNKFETENSYELKSFIKNLELDFRKYDKEVNDINESLLITIEEFQDNNKQIEILTPEIEKNHKNLEKISDKTKELIATHEINLSSDISLFEKNINDVSTKYHDSMTDITSLTENIFNKNIENSNNSIEKLYDKIKEKYNQLSSNSIHEMESLSKKIRQKINEEIKSTKLENIKELVSKFNKQLKQTVIENKLSIADIKKHFDEKVLEIDNKLETVAKKRRLF